MMPVYASVCVCVTARVHSQSVSSPPLFPASVVIGKTSDAVYGIDAQRLGRKMM